MTEKNPDFSHDSLDSRRHWLIFALLTACVAILAVAAMFGFRRWIDRHQRGLPRYAAERAMEALDRGDLKEAGRQAEVFAAERPYAGGTPAPDLMTPTKDGPVLRDRTLIGERLTAGLLKAGMLAEAEDTGWKTLYEYHATSRTIEMFDPWIMMLHVKLRRGEIGSAIGCLQILGEHGVTEFPQLDQLNPVAYPADPAAMTPDQEQFGTSLLSAFQRKAAGAQPSDWLLAAEQAQAALALTKDPGAIRRIRTLIQELQLMAGERDQARGTLGQSGGRDPSAMDPFWAALGASNPIRPPDVFDPLLLDGFWLDRPAGSKETLTRFIDSLAGDPRVRIDNLQATKPVENGRFAPRDGLSVEPDRDRVVFRKSCVAALEIVAEKPVERIFLEYGSAPALGVWPILLVKIDDAPPVPIDCDSAEPALAAIDVDLAAGRHRIEFAFLNEGIFVWGPNKIDERREVSLQRLALVYAGDKERQP